MANNVNFSTGIVRVGAVGATLTDAENIPNIQNFAWNAGFQEAVVRTAVFLSQYPTADAQYDGEVGFTFETTSFPELMIPFILGVSAVSAGGKRTYTGTLTAKPTYCCAEFLGISVDDKDIRIIIPRVKVAQFNPQFGRDSFQHIAFDFKSRPNGSNAPYILEIEE